MIILKRSTRLLAVLLFASAPALVHAQSWQFNTREVALKSGETTEVTDLYWVTNCRSLLTAPPEVTVMDAPPGITAKVEEAMVTPHIQQCSKPVKGGKLKVSAGQIDDISNSLVTLRVRFKTVDGDRDQAITLKMTLFP